MKRTIYSNYSLYDREDEVKDFLMKEYPELCTIEVENLKTGEITYEPTNETIWSQIYLDDEVEWDSTFADLKRFFKGKKVIFFGSLGLWTGNHDAGKIGDFEDLFCEAIRDCDYIEFTDDNGHLELKCSHHDGTSRFQIRVLTDKGYEYSENWAYGYSKKYDYSEQEMHNRITHCSQLSRLPYFCKKVWGV